MTPDSGLVSRLDQNYLNNRTLQALKSLTYCQLGRKSPKLLDSMYGSSKIKTACHKKFTQTLDQNIDHLMQINTKLNIGLCTLSTILDKNGLGLFMVRAGCCKVYQGCRNVQGHRDWSPFFPSDKVISLFQSGRGANHVNHIGQGCLKEKKWLLKVR